jgi:hypothetical protein
LWAKLLRAWNEGDLDHARQNLAAVIFAGPAFGSKHERLPDVARAVMTVAADLLYRLAIVAITFSESAHFFPHHPHWSQCEP